MHACFVTLLSLLQLIAFYNNLVSAWRITLQYQFCYSIFEKVAFSPRL